ncbi:MAG TPA: bifunctional phosphoglucose/phosphomannose isomerase [Anaerolineae bacterium]|nr:bifunctional phosphoglucose/phosphomannose isomerase [Anaerolineae bacterium]
MNLDDLNVFKKIDSLNMLSEIDNLPNQLEMAWQTGQDYPLPKFESISQVVISGMGGSAIGADMLTAYAQQICKVPICVHRNYGLPAWVNHDTLVISSSHSGNTEETFSSFEEALKKGAPIVAITTGGKLAEEARVDISTLWKFKHKGQPRAAVGFSFGLLLSLFMRLGLIPDQSKNVRDTIATLRMYQRTLKADVPVQSNPAKRMAGQAVGRWVVIIGADHFAPIARRWKTQINELAKAWAQFDFLPEADHNTLAGVINHEPILLKTMVLFLKGRWEHKRNSLRTDITSRELMVAGLNTEVLKFEYEHPLMEMWNSLLFGDYLAYYLAMLYKIDPTPVDAIENLKLAMK